MSIGMKIGHLRVIFTLPELNIHGQPAPTIWPKEHLAYIEWYKLSATAGANHNMYLVSKPPASAQGIIPGEIVPLKAIRQSCQLIPHTRPNVTWPSSWKSHTVLDLCSSFVLNNWASKFSYQTMW